MELFLFACYQYFNLKSQAIEDFEDEVMQGICRDLDLDNIESASQTNISVTTLRRSTRHSSTISRFSDITVSDNWPGQTIIRRLKSTSLIRTYY
uniref:Bestrophin homolog n=1 Tax=Meloidogyne floridensis TaxID=298350 RepID=A0A915P5N3_9BILA